MAKVSTLICTYNATSFFDVTIRSVLQQTYTNQEILIWDDGSSDGTLDLLSRRAAKDDRITVFSEPGTKRGPYEGLNFLLDQAQGAYIAIQDHDDIWHPEKLERQISFLESSEGADYSAAGCNMINHYIDHDVFVVGRKKQGPTRIVGHTGFVFRAGKYRYDTNLSVGNDSFFMYHNFNSIYLIQQPLVIHKIHNNNLGTKRSRNIAGRRHMYTHGLINFFSFCSFLYRGFFPYISLWLSRKIFSRKKYFPQSLLLDFGFSSHI